MKINMANEPHASYSPHPLIVAQNLRGKIAIVTGGARSIGYAICERLLLAGAATVVIVDWDETEGNKAAERLTAFAREFVPEPGIAIAFAVDVADGEAMMRLNTTLIARGYNVDLLVNNAGVTGKPVPLWEQTDENWDLVLGVNLRGTFNACRAVIAGMRERKSGSIVNVASVAGKEGNPNLIPYSVAKAGVIALTKALAKEVVMDGIRVNSVAPAVIETALLAQMTPETVAYMTAKILMGRMGQPEEVAAVVHFLLSSDASFVTGQCYDISGGRSTY
jgi:2-dehydro-3-deoxy-L-rhamnonate dehydrogenase (NAD+)